MPSLVSRAGALCAAVLGVSALDDGLARTPPMTTNSWTSFGSGVSAADLLTTGQLLVSTGLRDAGFTTVGSDDGWSLGTRDASGKLQADPGKVSRRPTWGGIGPPSLPHSPSPVLFSYSPPLTRKRSFLRASPASSRTLRP
jgi:hypothetical protein